MGVPMKVCALLAAIISLVFSLPAQEWEVDAAHADETKRLTYSATEGTWISLDISPDGKTIAFDLLGHIYEMPIKGGKAKALTTGRSWNILPRYSPDGNKIAFTSDRGGSEDLWVMNRSDGSLNNVSDDALPVFQGTWARDGRGLYGTVLNLRVRFPVYRFNFHGTRQELLPAGARNAIINLTEHPSNGLIYFETADAHLPSSGPRVKTFDMKTGEVKVYIDRPGGAFSISLSPDGNQLAYVHKDDLETELVVHDLTTGRERTLIRGLDYGRAEGFGFYGAYPNIDWHPDGREIIFYKLGGIYAVNVANGKERKIEFSATINREIDQTIRFKVDIPSGETTTRSHRWGQRAGNNIIFETMGDLFSYSGTKFTNLTRSNDHETDPVYHPRSGMLYYASWNDANLGAVYSRKLSGKKAKKLTTVPSQYGSIAVSPNGKSIAFLRGDRGIIAGKHLESQTAFELVVIGPDGKEQKVTDVHWTGNMYGKRPPTIIFAIDGGLIYSEYEDDQIRLKHIRTDGLDDRTLYIFPNATRAVISPDFQWIAFREYHRSFITPFEFAGQVVNVSAADSAGFSQRVDSLDGDFMVWSADGHTLGWTRGSAFYEKSVDDILDGGKSATGTTLSQTFTVATPKSTIAFTGVRVVTMNGDREVIENATVVIKDNRIAEIGAGVRPPSGAKVYDLSGHTIIPGMFDAHGHYGSPISALNVIEQNLYGLKANLAYGVTTMYEVYGTTQKDFWVSDMLRAGKLDGPRLFSVGDPVFVTKYRTKMHRPIQSLDDALEIARFNQDHGATALKDYSNHTRKARQQLATAARMEKLNLVTESFGNPQMNLTQIIDGFTGIEHTMGLEPFYEDVVKLFALSEIGMTPTLIVVYNGPSGETYFHQTERLWEDTKLLNFFTQNELIRFRRSTHYWEDDQYSRRMANALKKLAKAGTRLHMGAHGQMMGAGAHWEVELFVQGGFTPLEALEIATINGFTHHGLDHDLGSIEKGKLADMVILEQNPLEDIRNTRTIRYVMKNGVLYSSSDAARIYPDPKPAVKMYFK